MTPKFPPVQLLLLWAAQKITKQIWTSGCKDLYFLNFYNCTGSTLYSCRLLHSNYSDVTLMPHDGRGH